MKYISILPKISFCFGFLGVLILNFILTKHPNSFLIMQGAFGAYNILQLIFSTLMYKLHKSESKSNPFTFEILVFSMYLIFTVISVALYLRG